MISKLACLQSYNPECKYMTQKWSENWFKLVTFSHLSSSVALLKAHINLSTIDPFRKDLSKNVTNSKFSTFDLNICSNKVNDVTSKIVLTRVLCSIDLKRLQKFDSLSPKQHIKSIHLVA